MPTIIDEAPDRVWDYGRNSPHPNLYNYDEDRHAAPDQRYHGAVKRYEPRHYVEDREVDGRLVPAGPYRPSRERARSETRHHRQSSERHLRQPETHHRQRPRSIGPSQSGRHGHREDGGRRAEHDRKKEHATENAIGVAAKAVYHVRGEAGSWVGTKGVKVIGAAVASAAIEVLLDPGPGKHVIQDMGKSAVQKAVVHGILDGWLTGHVQV